MIFLRIRLILLTFFLFSLLPSKVNSQTVDKILTDLITRNAADYWLDGEDGNWKVSLSQYQAWIGLISLQEAGDGRTVAHSGWRGDQFYWIYLPGLIIGS